MIVLVDNYDSFSYNLYQLFGALNPDIEVVRNDALSVDELAAMNPDGLVLSPGPGRPEDAGICVEAVKRLAGKVPILGVCLGHQAICVAFDGKVSYADKLMHGKSSICNLVPSSPLFKGLPGQVEVARYHSLEVHDDGLPACLKVTARTADTREIMAIGHVEMPVFGLQFHPESILTPCGEDIARNFLALCK